MNPPIANRQLTKECAQFWLLTTVIEEEEMEVVDFGTRGKTAFVVFWRGREQLAWISINSNGADTQSQWQ